MAVNLLYYFETKAKKNEDNRILYPVTPIGGNKVGSGKYTRRSKQVVVFDGKTTQGKKGPFGLTLDISEDQCTLIVNGTKEKCSDKKVGQRLQVTTNKNDTLTFYSGGGGTYIDGVPKLDGSVWIGK